MYKTVFIDYEDGGYDIQLGKTAELENLLNEWHNKGYELISMTSCSYPNDATCCSFILTFKSI